MELKIFKPKRLDRAIKQANLALSYVGLTLNDVSKLVEENKLLNEKIEILTKQITELQTSKKQVGFGIPDGYSSIDLFEEMMTGIPKVEKGGE